MQEEKKLKRLQKKCRKLEQDICCLEQTKLTKEQELLDLDALLELKERQREDAIRLEESPDLQERIENAQKVALADRLVEVTGQSVEELTHALMDPAQEQDIFLGR